MIKAGVSCLFVGDSPSTQGAAPAVASLLAHSSFHFQGVPTGIHSSHIMCDLWLDHLRPSKATSPCNWLSSNARACGLPRCGLSMKALLTGWGETYAMFGAAIYLGK
jgi:hypothetical protein